MAPPRSSAGTSAPTARSRCGRSPTPTGWRRPWAATLYWITGYGGGLFLPFGDATAPGETFGGGRYVLDAIKGADLGTRDGRLIVDFNFAYNPSCAHTPAWTCPLAPPENHLPTPIRAGEMAPPGSGP